MSEKLLEVKNLKTYFYTDDGVVKSVDGVSFSVEKGKTLGIVGESGCGKSITSLSIMQLVETPPGKIVDGEIIYEGEDLLKKNKEEMRKIRGGQIAMIFQEPMTSLNPVFTVGEQIMEALRIHTDLDKHQAKERAIEMLKLVKIPLAEKRFNEYPHQLSGGMRMLRRFINRIGRTVFYYPSGIHNHDVIRYFRNNSEVMGNHHDRCSEFFLQFIDQIQNLGLNGHIQSGCRLITDQKLRITGQGHGDHDTLTHTAG